MTSEQNNPLTRLEVYLQQVEQRLRQLMLWRGIAVLAGAFVLVSVALAWWAVNSGFDPVYVTGGRLLLLVLLVVGALLLIRRPLKKISSQLPGWLESRVESFDGRIRTFVGLHAAASPMRRLLANDCIPLLGQHPPQELISGRQLLWPRAIVASISSPVQPAKGRSF